MKDRPPARRCGAGPLELGVALTGRDEHGAEDDDEHEPVRELDGRGHPARDRAQHEATGDREDVGDDHSAPDRRVGEREREVGRADEHERGAVERAGDEAGGHERRTEAQGRMGTQLARGDGAQALAWVAPVLGGIADVVDGVEAGSEQGEGDEREGDTPGHVVVDQGPGSGGGGDDEGVLHPLARAHGHQRGAHYAAPGSAVTRGPPNILTVSDGPAGGRRSGGGSGSQFARRCLPAWARRVLPVPVASSPNRIRVAWADHLNRTFA